MYFFNIVSLLIEGKIGWRTAAYALRERPIAVAGRRAAYIVDPSFDRN